MSASAGLSPFPAIHGESILCHSTKTTILRDYTTKLYYEIILRDHTTRLYYEKSAVVDRICRFMFVHNNFNYASKFLSIATKVVLSQVIYAPLFNVYFFSAQSLLSGASWAETLQRLQVTLPVSIVNSAKIWPAVSAFMFLYIDPAFRAIFAGTIALGWQTYLSWLNQVAAKEVREREVVHGKVPV
ncbi:hypothetical protein H113_05432 [Trichophyton rubrum MR1459]|uniref:Integral membrane protein n=1 Tax=Trichophyton rubrum (strain ATCC MYA-4607 / CBS 118892) TaxID=559305 RepID=F2SML5_TRIRC|nr:uncharacterized protein TERG_03122 [Trichophyton rubrum CBS 118892]EGD86867.2 hypothetical protein TERG_03122 [Trichophyton rubrum CBS 118892]EZF93908.1 hypothetical protein H113_05432 [Trichophyton rubrum MR1459]EZG04982.1 hypothetical protein H106_05228 [Trichophyton rubrum CBS 735.88]